MRGALSACFALASFAVGVQAFLPKPFIPRNKYSKKLGGSVFSANGTKLPPLETVYHFDQLIDHGDPSKGTFKQRYWSTWEFYEPGGPIILMNPGEGNADGYYADYLTNSSINGMIAQQEKGATVLVEHRFFGESNPYKNLSSASLSLLNINQSIADMVYFAENVKLPMPGGDKVSPKQAPWVLVGGSYAGALTAWIKVASPDTFYAAYASSAVVEAINDFWQYFQPIRENMPANCSADVVAVISHVDSVVTGTNKTAINETKALFGMSGLSHYDDFTSALRNPLWAWQRLQPTDENEGDFFRFCDALEMKDGVAAPAEGWGLEHALTAWGNYSTDFLVPNQCGNKDIEKCLGTYNATSTDYTSIEVDNDLRSWTWFVCNEVGWYQASAPEGTPSLVSRTIRPEYDARFCTYMFPEVFKTIPAANTNATNTNYHGWSINEPRLFFANGKRDPWREATVSAETQNIQSTSLQPIAVGDGFHCSDLLASAADDTVKAVQKQALAAMKEWLATWTAPIPAL